MLGFRLNVSPQKSTQILRIQSDGLWHSISVRGLPLLSCSVQKTSALSAFTHKFSVENSQRGDEQQSKLSL